MITAGLDAGVKTIKAVIVRDIQYVTKKHPEAQHLLTRDIKNVLRYFERGYNLKTDVNEALTFVRDS